MKLPHLLSVIRSLYTHAATFSNKDLNVKISVCLRSLVVTNRSDVQRGGERVCVCEEMAESFQLLVVMMIRCFAPAGVLLTEHILN